jgi:hypothetical protein
MMVIYMKKGRTKALPSLFLTFFAVFYRTIPSGILSGITTFFQVS